MLGSVVSVIVKTVSVLMPLFDIEKVCRTKLFTKEEIILPIFLCFETVDPHHVLQCLVPSFESSLTLRVTCG